MPYYFDLMQILTQVQTYECSDASYSARLWEDTICPCDKQLFHCEQALPLVIRYSPPGFWSVRSNKMYNPLMAKNMRNTRLVENSSS